MPRDYSKPPRPGGGPKRDGSRFGQFFKKSRDGRDRPQDDDRGFRQPYGERRDFRPPRYDEELFTAHGKVADIVGSAPQSRFDLLRKLWDFFRAEELIVPASHHPRPNADDWRHGGRDFQRDEREDHPPRHHFRKPAGKHPMARKRRSLEGVPRRKFKETRER